jgi:PAS domain S-box-containing protein
MKKEKMTRAEAIRELNLLRQRVKELEESASGAALSESEGWYRILAESAKDVIFIVDGEGSLQYINPVGADLLKSDRGEIIGKKLKELFPQETEKEQMFFIRKVIDSGRSVSNDQKFFFPDGDIWLDTRLIPIPAQGDRAPLVMGISRDITERKKAEAALKKSEQKYRTVLETIEDGYYEVDLAGNLTFFNNAFAGIHAFPQEELLGMNSSNYTDAENGQILLREFTRVFQTQKPSKGIHYDIITKSGERRSLETSISLIKDTAGNFTGFRGIARDITELRRAQRALQKSEERFRIVAENTNDFIFEQDFATGQLEWFGTAIEKLRDLFGEIPHTEAAYEKLIHPEDHDRIVEEIRRHIRNRKPFQQEYRLVGRDGKILYLLSQGISLWDEKGDPYKWIGALSNISDRKRVEEELKESVEKLHKVMGGIIKAMALTVENRDPYTAGHQQRVSSLARAIAQEMGLSKDQIEAVRMAGAVHDLGKISVPAEILSKPSRLSDIEFDLIKVHPQTTYDILKGIEFPWPIARIVLQHHERINGSGYPAGLTDREILPEAKVLMVADVVEAMASHRPYRPAKGIKMALEEISENRGMLYDLTVVEACLRLFQEKGYAFDPSRLGSQK